MFPHISIKFHIFTIKHITLNFKCFFFAHMFTQLIFLVSNQSDQNAINILIQITEKEKKTLNKAKMTLLTDQQLHTYQNSLIRSFNLHTL